MKLIGGTHWEVDRGDAARRSAGLSYLSRNQHWEAHHKTWQDCQYLLFCFAASQRNTNQWFSGNRSRYHNSSIPRQTTSPGCHCGYAPGSFVKKLQWLHRLTTRNLYSHRIAHVTASMAKEVLGFYALDTAADRFKQLQGLLMHLQYLLMIKNTMERRRYVQIGRMIKTL
jgi:hypothetical protein